MGPAELTGLQSFHSRIPSWVEHEVQSDLGSKDSIWLHLSDDIFSSFLSQLLQPFLIGLFIHQQIAFFKICRDAARKHGF